MKCSVFIACSADGYIAKKDGNIDFLTNAVEQVDLGADADMGFNAFLEHIDCIIMGRKTMEVIAGFNLKDEDWPYGDRKIVVLSKTLNQLPDSVKNRMSLFNGNIEDLTKKLEKEGKKHAYIDGGTSIRSFLKLDLINQIIITRIPVLLGDGVSLFEGLEKEVRLRGVSSKYYKNGCIQETYLIP